MSIDGIGDLIARAHALAGEANKPAPDASERERLTALASEFESMLLLQMLKEMRKAGSWDVDGDADTLGAETLFETLDVELAKHLANAQTLGLRKELLQAFDHKYGSGSSAEARPAEAGSYALGLALPAEAGSYALGLRRPAEAGSDSPSSVPSDHLSSVASGARSSVASGFSRKTETAVGSSTAAAFAPIHSSSAPVIEHFDEDGMDELTRPAGKVTSAFGWRTDPFKGTNTFHGGIDVRAAYGQDVASAGAGRVVLSGDERGYGTTVVVEHADGVRTRYAHLSAALVKSGDTVTAGQVLGRAGQSGRATGPHLHFEVTVNGERVDPARIGLKPEGVVADLAVRRTTPFTETD